jgi:hypothetical protein
VDDLPATRSRRRLGVCRASFKETRLPLARRWTIRKASTMTDLQRAELVMVLQGFKENKKPKSVNGEEWRLQNIERAMEQILDILSAPAEKR